jgi:hypothetical protein
MFQIVNDDRFSILIILAWYLALAWSAVKLGLFFWRKRLKAFAEPQAPIALALAACLCVWGASQINRNFYETAHYLPMAAVFCALCLTLPRPEPRETEPLLVTTACLSLLVMLPSAIMVVSMSLGPLIEANRYRGYIPRQEISVPVFGYDKIRQDVSAAMKQAGMDPARRYHRLLIDDVTYLALQNNTFPLHRLGVLSVWNGEIKDPVRYLISRNSDGVVMGCKFLPKRMRDVAASSNGVCAISRKTLDQIDTGTGDGTG